MTLKGITLAEKLRLAREAGVSLPHYTNTDNPVDFPKTKTMNSLIKQLAEQAGGGPSKWYTDPDVLEKFAELIVAECVELVSAKRDLAIEDGWNVDEAMSTAINDIEEHFGVEE
jgi:hypothetical protein